MEASRRLFSNSVAMAAANVAGRGLGYAYIILMARRLDARYLGAYALLLTASMLIELVSNLGLDKIMVREISAGSASVWTRILLGGAPHSFCYGLCLRRGRVEPYSSLCSKDSCSLRR